jgi:hypothetical protein
MGRARLPRGKAMETEAWREGGIGSLTFEFARAEKRGRKTRSLDPVSRRGDLSRRSLTKAEAKSDRTFAKTGKNFPGSRNSEN